MINPINFLKRPFTRRKLAHLRQEHTRLEAKAAQARKVHGSVAHIQASLESVTARILSLGAKYEK